MVSTVVSFAMCEKIEKVMFTVSFERLYELTHRLLLAFVHHPGFMSLPPGEQLAQRRVRRPAGAALRGQHKDRGHPVPAGTVQ